MNSRPVAAPMIISRTPVRVSFCGGGTDLPAFYAHEAEGGLVTSMALARYIYVTVNRRFDEGIRVSYSRTEIVEAGGTLDDLQHELVREAMRMTGVTSGVEITTIADIPARGTGLGSSSTLTVGLLNALYAYQGRYVSPEKLARQACEIEIDILGQPIGKQDQYAAAFGGINRIRFHPDESVTVDPVLLGQAGREQMEAEFFLVYTGVTRSASGILARQSANTGDRMAQLRELRDQAQSVKIALEQGRFADVGRLLDATWQVKKTLADGISGGPLDALYEAVMAEGATGGKLLGAGGGGFFLFHAPAEVRQRVHEALPEHRILPLMLEPNGSRIIHHDEGAEPLDD